MICDGVQYMLRIFTGLAVSQEPQQGLADHTSLPLADLGLASSDEEAPNCIAAHKCSPARSHS